MSELTKAPMKWYAASAIFVTLVNDQGVDSPMLVEERIYLVCSADDTSAMDKAISFAKQEQDPEGEFPLELDDKPARAEFVGIRKLITVRRHTTDFGGCIQEVADGCEATFSFFDIRDRKQLEQLVSGDAVELIYRKEMTRQQTQG